MLDYLPYIDNEAQIPDAQTALIAIASRRQTGTGSARGALQDKLVLRRAAAAEALVRGAGADAPAVRKLLKDADKKVRLYVAVALVTGHDKESVPALIDLLRTSRKTSLWRHKSPVSAGRRQVSGAGDVRQRGGTQKGP